MKIILCALLMVSAHAFAKPKRETIFEFTQAAPVQNTFTAAEQQKEAPEAPKPQLFKAPSKPKVQLKGNLPAPYMARDSKRLQRTAVAINVPAQIKTELRSLRMGDMILAEIPHWIIAFPDEKAPVLATVTDSKLKGAKFLGETWLEKNSRRIFIDFKYVTIGRKTYSIQGRGLTSLGVPGFEGIYHSNEFGLFSGTFLASFIAGYFEGQIPQVSTPYGQIIQDNSLDSAWKKGMSTGAMQTAEAFREKLKKVPEFSELRGPTQVSILITDEGKLK